MFSGLSLEILLSPIKYAKAESFISDYFILSLHTGLPSRESYTFDSSELNNIDTKLFQNLVENIYEVMSTYCRERDFKTEATINIFCQCFADYPRQFDHSLEAQDDALKSLIRDEVEPLINEIVIEKDLLNYIAQHTWSCFLRERLFGETTIFLYQLDMKILFDNGVQFFKTTDTSDSLIW